MGMDDDPAAFSVPPCSGFYQPGLYVNRHKRNSGYLERHGIDIRGTFYFDPLDSERYFQVDSVLVKLTIGGLVLRLVGRDSGDLLLKALNQFLYKHREVMKIEMLPSMSTYAGILIGRLANIIYSACPFKYLAQI